MNQQSRRDLIADMVDADPDLLLQKQRVRRLLIAWVAARLVFAAVDLALLAYLPFGEPQSAIQDVVAVAVALVFAWLISTSREVAILPLIGGVMTFVQPIVSETLALSLERQVPPLIALCAIAMAVGAVQAGVMAYLFFARSVRPYYEAMRRVAQMLRSGQGLK